MAPHTNVMKGLGSFTRLDDPGADACVFCRIVREQLPARLVAQTSAAVAFLDADPIVRGHCLVVQRSHAVDLIQTTATDLADTITLVKTVVEGVTEALDARGCSVWQTNGESARQTVPHTHFHVLPRYSSMRDTTTFPERSPDAADDIDEVHETLRRHFEGAL